MKRLVVVLALTNVLTLLGLAICATMLVMNSAQSTVEEVQQTSDNELQAQFAKLEAQYLAAKEREEFWRERLREDDHEPENSRPAPPARDNIELEQLKSQWERKWLEQQLEIERLRTANQASAPRSAGEGTRVERAEPVSGNSNEPRARMPQPEAPKPTGIEAWRLMMVDYNAEFPERSKAIIEVPGKDGEPEYKAVRIRDMVDGWTVKMLEPTRVIVEDNHNHQRVIGREHSVALAKDGEVEYQQIGPADPRAFQNSQDRHADGGAGPAPTPPGTADVEPESTEAPEQANGSSEAGPEFTDGTVMTTPDGTTKPDVDGVERPATDDERRRIEAEAMAEGDDVDLPAGVAARTVRHLLTAEQMVAIKSDWRKVLLQALFEGHFDPDKGEFDGVRLVSFPRNSIYSLYGFQLDDVIQAVNGQPVRTGSDIDELPYKTDFTKGATIQVMRDGLVIIYRFIADPDLLAAHEAKLEAEDAARREMLDAARESGYPQPIPTPEQPANPSNGNDGNGNGNE